MHAAGLSLVRCRPGLLHSCLQRPQRSMRACMHPWGAAQRTFSTSSVSSWLSMSRRAAALGWSQHPVAYAKSESARYLRLVCSLKWDVFFECVLPG